MKILIADKLSPKTVEALSQLGATVNMNPELTAEALPTALDDTTVLIVRSTQVTAAAIDAAPELSLIIRAGAGVNTIDLAEASARGIHVANCPGKNADAVAELAIGLLVAADRRIGDQTMDLRAGRWDKKAYGKAGGLMGRTLGILGLGSIGRGVAMRAKAFGMNVVAWSRSLSPEKAKEWGIGYCASPRDVARQADAVSVHLAATAETRKLVDREFLRDLGDGSIFVNTSRGEIVDEEALIQAIEEQGLKVALDVYAQEPAATDKEFPHTGLAKAITGTHHIGASTDQASEAIADEVVKIVEAYKNSGKPLNTVNAQDKSPAPFGLVVRHYNRVGVLAGVLDALREEDINVEEMENAIFSGGTAAVCSLKLDQEPREGLLANLRSNPDIIQVARTE